MAFRSPSTEKNFKKRIAQQGIVDLIWFGGGVFSSSAKLKLQFVCGRQKAEDYMKMLNDLSLAQEECRLCGEEWIFQQENTAIHNASITKKYLLEQKIRLRQHPAYSSDINPIENLWWLTVARVCEGGRLNSSLSELKNAI